VDGNGNFDTLRYAINDESGEASPRFFRKSCDEQGLGYQLLAAPLSSRNLKTKKVTVVRDDTD